MLRIHKKENGARNMEIHFPHLTNGIAKATPTRRQRAGTLRKVLLTAGVCGTLALSVSFAFASTMNQEMIAQQEKLQVEMCYKLKKKINAFMFVDIPEVGLPTFGDAKYLESLTNIYANYCKR